MNTINRSWRPVQHRFPPRRIWQVASGIILFAIGMIAAFILSSPNPKATTTAVTANESEEPGTRVEVKLTPDKMRTAKLHASACQLRELHDSRTVPGMIEFNPANHLQIKAVVDGIVRRVLIDPGKAVKKGESLAVLVCPEIGMARDALAQCQAELEITKRESRRLDEIADNVGELLKVLKEHPQPAEIEKQFSDKLLGPQRQQIVGAYSKLHLAESVIDNSRALEANGGISGRLLQERRSEREVAKAEFDTACEESKFAVTQAREKARTAMEHAERMVAVSREKLESLGVANSESESGSQTALSDLVLKAPFAGVIQEASAVAGAPISAGQSLFVLADTQSLWVSAEVPQRDWNALDGEAQHELVLRFPGLSDSEVAATVRFTSGKISPETHTLSIVGELQNRAAHFRPGMFVWVSIPVGQPRRVLAVPAAAIVQNEEAKFVFVAASADTFRRVDVTTGLETPDWVEIKEGLTEGQEVVDSGTFALKSELLLEHEAG
jgi:cobalt-zinc-cadmium efflux system membrane fusion protein